MSDYRKILIAVDLGRSCSDVIKRAQQLVSGSEAEIHLVHVVEMATGDYSFELDFSHLDAYQKVHRAAAEEAAQVLLSELGLELPPASVHLPSGHPAREIRKLCGELGVDLLVIGSHGEHAVLSMLGSTASAVMHGIGCDVLTVRI